MTQRVVVDDYGVERIVPDDMAYSTGPKRKPPSERIRAKRIEDRFMLHWSSLLHEEALLACGWLRILLERQDVTLLSQSKYEWSPQPQGGEPRYITEAAHRRSVSLTNARTAVLDAGITKPSNLAWAVLSGALASDWTPQDAGDAWWPSFGRDKRRRQAAGVVEKAADAIIEAYRQSQRGE